MRAVVIAIALIAAGCGEDDEGGGGAKPGNATPATPAGGAAGAPGQGSAKQLSPQLHIEERVECKPPQADPTKKCDPKLGICESKNEYCMLTNQGSFCGPCPERDGIRHQFKSRDFVATENRDPFAQPGQSPTSGDDKMARDVTQRCLKKEQLIATTYSYQDLTLVGIVAQGTQRKALMLDTGPVRLGWIVRRGDCVGKEKAVVKDIGANYITFELADPNQTAREPEQRSVQLHTELPVVSAPPTVDTGTTRGASGAPVIEPPKTDKQSQPKGNTVIVPAPQPSQGPQAPQRQSPPIMINP